MRARGAVREGDASLRWRARVFAAHMERAAVAYMTARMRTLLHLPRVDDARFQREAPRFASLERGLQRAAKAGAAELSGVAQTGFLRMEECSRRR